MASRGTLNRVKSFIPRALDLAKLLKKKSLFLFGPRGIGKSSLVRHALPGARVIDLLDDDMFLTISQRPRALGELIRPSDKLVVIDEVQKVPAILDEVHRLIESSSIRFLLTGSSARKLRARGVNLLGGRAWEALLLPLTSREILKFDLLRILNRGGMPHIYLSEEPAEELRAYVSLYLREEVKAEALVRNLGAFSRFIDVLALANGEELHLQNLASDAAVPVRTLEGFLHVVEDTLLGFQVPPFLSTRKRKAITRSKFYFFDVGVVGALTRRGEVHPKSELFGRTLEHFLMLELRAYLSYARRDEPLQYWRSTSGFEVDCVVGDTLAVEFKSTGRVGDSDLRGLKALREEKRVSAFAIVTTETQRRTIDGIEVYPVKDFLTALWDGELLAR